MKWISTTRLVMTLGLACVAGQAMAQSGNDRPVVRRTLGTDRATEQADPAASGPNVGHAAGGQRDAGFLCPRGRHRGHGRRRAGAAPARRRARRSGMDRGRQRHERQDGLLERRGPLLLDARQGLHPAPRRMGAMGQRVVERIGGHDHRRHGDQCGPPGRSRGRHRAPRGRRLLAPHPPRDGRQLLGNLRVPLELRLREQSVQHGRPR